MDVDNGNKRVFNRLGGGGGGGGGGPSSGPQSQKVCYFWKSGNCYKNPCPYLHGEPNHQNNNFQQPKRLQQDDRNNVSSSQQTFARRKPNPTYNNSTQQMSSKWGRGHGGVAGGGFRPPQKVPDRVCHFWLAGKCKFGDTCKFQHPAFLGEGFSMLTQLTGHSKVISGISFPLGSDKLYSGSKDESVRVWDCQTGQCSAVVNLASEVGCMINEGPWIFVGVPDAVKAWNTQTNTELSLNGPVGQVYALVVGNGMLFAGTQDGNILVWRYNAATNTFDPAASLMGHSRSVVSLVVGANRLYSGSMDHTIRVWDLDTLQCIETLKEHTSVVMSVLCWEQFLLSCSLDQTIKVWVASESGSLEVTYTHIEEHGVLALCGMHDAQAKPVLLCSCNDNTVRLYDLPSFNERGKIFSKEETRAIQVGPGGLFFTGDGTGELKVWKWSDA